MRKQSKRRMQVAQKRIALGIDVLKRKTRRANRWSYLEFFQHVELNHQWALPHRKVCMRRDRRNARKRFEQEKYIAYEEGMQLYHKIKQRHDDLFHDLASL